VCRFRLDEAILEEGAEDVGTWVRAGNLDRGSDKSGSSWEK
jgi:hypothetical protein